MMKVLLAVDQSRHSLAAARFVQRIQLPAGSDLYLLHVNTLIEWPELSASGRSLHLVERINIIRAEVTTRARQLLSHMEEKFRSQNQNIHSLVREGIAGAEIMRAIMATCFHSGRGSVC